MFRQKVAKIEPKQLVIVDESGANTAMTRLYARAPTGERAIGSVPLDHYASLTMLGALRLEGVVALATVPAATDTDVFSTFVSQSLLPALRKGDVVVWDRLQPHKVATVRQVVESAGAKLMLLPAYSPDLSPMEPCWSKVKQHLRAVEPRTPEALGQAAGDAFASITANDIHGWFEHCGLRVH